MRRIIDPHGRPFADRWELEEGEPMPYACECGEVYQPPLESLRSACPVCGRLNDHDAQDWALIEEGE